MRVSHFLISSFVLLLIIQADLYSVKAFPAPFDDDIGIFPIVRDISCYNVDGIPHTELIPHPTNCTRFFICDLDAEFKPQPQPNFCQENLIYNFNKCECDWASNIEHCYNEEDPEHQKNRFQCACPMVKNSDGQYVEDEKCRSRTKKT